MTQTATPTRAAPKRDVVPVRHWGRMAGAAVVVLLVLGAAYSFATNPNFEWTVVGEYLFSKAVLKGLLLTLEMTAIGMVIALALAVVIGVMRMSPSRVIAAVAAAWVFFFRGVPLIVLLILVGNLGLFFRTITIGNETAKALGLNRAQTLRHIVLPQALRVIIPPLGNESIGMLKASAIVSVIAGGDLLTVVEGISGINFRTIEMLIVATIWYLLVISIYSVAQFFMERRAAER
jgi:polar amino acid transport system permease protein